MAVGDNRGRGYRFRGPNRYLLEPFQLRRRDRSGSTRHRADDAVNYCFSKEWPVDHKPRANYISEWLKTECAT